MSPKDDPMETFLRLLADWRRRVDLLADLACDAGVDRDKVERFRTGQEGMCVGCHTPVSPPDLACRAHRPSLLTPNQVVGYNLSRARALRGWTQEQTVARLAPHLGARWSNVVLSAAERSYAGKRIRHFTADEIVAFAQTFDLPVTWFFLPPGADPPAESRPTGEGEVNL
jgi:hypothetical protein